MLQHDSTWSSQTFIVRNRPCEKCWVGWELKRTPFSYSPVVNLLWRYHMPLIPFYSYLRMTSSLGITPWYRQLYICFVTVKKMWQLTYFFKGHISGQSYWKEDSLVYHKMLQRRLRVDWWTEGERGKPVTHALLRHLVR